MSDNQKTPDEVLLPEGESLELLIAPDLPPELMPPAETALLDAPVDAIVQSEVVDAVSLGDTFPQESYLTEEPIPEVQPLDDVPATELTPLSEDDPALFDAVIPETPVELTPSDEVVNFVEVTQEDTPAPIIVSEAVSITGETQAMPIVVSEPTSMPANSAPTESSSSEVVETTISTPSPVVMDTPVAPPAMSVGDAPSIVPPGVHHTSHIGLIIGGIALLGAAIVGAWFMLGSDEDTKPKTDIEYTISAEQEPQQTYETIVEQQVTQTADNATLMNQAFSENDSTLCAKISTPDMQSECRESLLARSLVQSGTIEDCQTLTIENIKVNCTMTIQQNNAITSMNKAACASISDATQAQYCREAIDEKVLVNLVETKTATEAGCKQLEEKYQSTCMTTIVHNDDNAILNTAVEKDDLDACNNLSDEELKFVCFDTILLKRAFVSKDKNLCDYVKDETKKATCISYASAQDDNATFKNAIIEKDLSLCSTIGNISLGNRCHDSVTLLVVRDTKNAALCDTLIATGSIDSCKKSVGVQ